MGETPARRALGPIPKRLRAIARAVALAASACAGLASAEAGPPTEVALPFLAVGRFGPAELSLPNCTAVLVAPDRVLTAGHCVGRDGAGGSFKGTGPWFEPGRHGERAPVAARALGWRLHDPVAGAPLAGTPSAGSPFAGSPFARDAALITLDRRLAVPPVPIGADVRPGEPLRVLAYPRHRAGRQVTQDCVSLGVDAGLILLDCAVTSGMSGAPLLALRDGRWSLVGLVVAALNGDGPTRAVAMMPRPGGFGDAAGF